MMYSYKLKELREDKNISQQDLSKELDIDNSLLAIRKRVLYHSY